MNGVENYVLQDCRKTQKIITVFMVNGYKLTGSVSAFDDVCIELVDEDGYRKLLYKQAISTINFH
jgi:RNA chaperone Hfq